MTVGGGVTDCTGVGIASGKIGAAARGRRTEDDEDGDQTPMTATSTGTGLGAGRKNGELGDGCSGRQASIRSIHVNRHFAGDLVHPEALGSRPALAVGHDGKTLCAVGELPGRTFGRQGKHNRGAGDRLMILIFNANDGVASDALANIIYGAFAFHYDNIEFGRHGLRMQRAEK